MDEDCHPTDKDTNKTEFFNAFFSSVFNISEGLWDTWSPKLEECDCGNNKHLANSKLVGDLLLQFIES